MMKFIWIFILINLTGCAAPKIKGPLFTPITLNSEAMALVYVYRPSGEKYGYARTYYLYNEEEKIVDLEHGGYFPFEVAAGKVSLLADVNYDAVSFFRRGGIFMYAIENSLSTNATLEFEAERGKSYFIRFKPINHFTYFEPTLSLMAEGEGLVEISKSRLIEAKE